jgi:ABC-type uncharacterized transport system permease subunit
VKRTILRILPFALLIIGLAIFNYSICVEAIKGDNQTLRVIFIVIEIIIPFLGSMLALRIEKSVINRFMFAMFGFFGGFLISLDLFVVSLIQSLGK